MLKDMWNAINFLILNLNVLHSNLPSPFPIGHLQAMFQESYKREEYLQMHASYISRKIY